MNESAIRAAAAELLACEAGRRTRQPFTGSGPLTLEDAYAIQDETLRRRLARGETLTGVKLGLTSVEKQRGAGVDTSIVAWLTDAMAVAGGDPVPCPRLVHPRAEPEIVFWLGRDLVGPGVTAAQAMAAVEWVCGGAEVPDSRWEGTGALVADTVADDAGAAAYIVGPVRLRPDEIDLATESVTVEIDGKTADIGTGAAVLGHPGEALAQAANVLGGRGLRLRAGQLVFSGAMANSFAVTPGATIRFRFEHLGSIDVVGEA